MNAIGFCLLHQHDLRILALAVLLTILTFLTTGALVRRSYSSRLRPQMWTGLAGLCIAIGAWSIHFVAMLAYLLGVATSFRFGATMASLALVTATPVPAAVLSRADRRPVYGRAACGIAFGLGVAGMHYLGMRAFHAPGRLAWSLEPIIMSVALSAGLSAVGFAGWGLTSAHRRRLPIAGVFVALSILSLHFFDMSAITFQFDPRIVAPTSSLSCPRAPYLHRLGNGVRAGGDPGLPRASGSPKVAWANEVAVAKQFRRSGPLEQPYDRGRQWRFGRHPHSKP